MKNFNQYLTERYELNLNNSIIVDIQPEYQQAIRFNLNEFAIYLTKLINNNKKILYYYNGPDTLGMSSKEEIIHWLLETYNFENYEEQYEELYTILYNNIIWIDKSYGFLRDFIDSGIDDATIVKIIRYMAVNRIYSSNEINHEEMLKITDEDLRRNEINLPPFRIDLLKQFSGSYIMGGGINECLKEIQLIMNAFNIKYTTFQKFVY